MIRMVRLTQPEPYRVVGSNTQHAPAVTVTLRPPRLPVRLSRKVAA